MRQVIPQTHVGFFANFRLPCESCLRKQQNHAKSYKIIKHVPHDPGRIELHLTKFPQNGSQQDSSHREGIAEKKLSEITSNEVLPGAEMRVKQLYSCRTFGRSGSGECEAQLLTGDLNTSGYCFGKSGTPNFDR